jgi:predicted nucleotidyltransferase
MTTTPFESVSKALLRQMAAEIRKEIPEAEVRLFGSHARGEARSDSDIDLLITVTDDWLSHHNRFEVLDRLRWRLSQPLRPVDLLCFPVRRWNSARGCIAAWFTRPTPMACGSMAEIEAMLPPPALPRPACAITPGRRASPALKATSWRASTALPCRFIGGVADAGTWGQGSSGTSRWVQGT